MSKAVLSVVSMGEVVTDDYSWRTLSCLGRRVGKCYHYLYSCLLSIVTPVKARDISICSLFV